MKKVGLVLAVSACYLMILFLIFFSTMGFAYLFLGCDALQSTNGGVNVWPVFVFFTLSMGLGLFLLQITAYPYLIYKVRGVNRIAKLPLQKSEIRFWEWHIDNLKRYVDILKRSQDTL